MPATRDMAPDGAVAYLPLTVWSLADARRGLLALLSGYRAAYIARITPQGDFNPRR
jgi:hypothetical protein